MQRSHVKLMLLCHIACSFGCLHLQAKSANEQQKTIEISDYERELYLTPGGKYTVDDIQANGSMTRSQKFKEFISSHRPPNTGDQVCPITATKAHPQCSWIIGGKSYQFCCPPCIDEFLALAKTSPEQIKDPELYIK